MTEGPTAPKKLKLTLKLNNNSSSTTSSGKDSKINSSTLVSPVKPTAREANSAVAPLIDLPTGLGNLKGRGRPKKTAAASNVNNSSVTESNDPSVSTVTVTSGATVTPSTSTSASSDHLAELKSFVSSMKTFKPRSWSLKRPVSLSVKNVAGYEVCLPAGLWCTATSELGSAHLRIEVSEEPADPSVYPTAVFEAKCQCGKVFNDRSKYRKHVKIHEKPKEPVVPPVTVTVANAEVPPVPTISLKLKLNTSNQ